MANFEGNIIIYRWIREPSTASCAMGGLSLLRPCRSKNCHPQKMWTKRVVLQWPSSLSTNLHVRRCWHQRQCTDIDRNTPSCQKHHQFIPMSLCITTPTRRWQSPPLIAIIIWCGTSVAHGIHSPSTYCFFKVPHPATFWCLYYPIIAHLVHDIFQLLRNLNLWSQCVRFPEWILKQDGLVIIQSLQTMLALLQERDKVPSATLYLDKRAYPDLNNIM